MNSRTAVSNVIRGLNVNTIKPYNNIESITIENLDTTNKITGDNIIINSTRDVTSNNNRINKTFYVKFNTTTKKILLSEDETNWFSQNHTLILYAGATYTFIQKNISEYNNNTNPFLISTKNIYQKPRLTPLYNDNIIYQVYNTDTSTWTTKIPADPDGINRSTIYYTQPFTSSITQRKVIFSPTQHKIIYYITEQFLNPNISGGILNIKSDNYKYAAAITNSGLGVKYNLNIGNNFLIDDIFIVNNTNTITTTDKINTNTPLPNHYKIQTSIGSILPRSTLDLGHMNSAFKIPTGNDTNEKPSGITGMIRYNNEIKDYEGRGSTDWGTLGGIQDIDMDTKIVIYPGQTTDNLASLDFVTQSTSKLFLDYRGASINHKKPSAMLDIKGNLALSTHNVGGVLFGSDTSNTDNYLNVVVNNNSTNSLDFSSFNGGMITNIKKNIIQNINENKTSILGNYSESIHGYHTIDSYNKNKLKYNSSLYKKITSTNTENFKNNSNYIFNNLNTTVNGNSVETYNNSVSINNSLINYLIQTESFNFESDVCYGLDENTGHIYILQQTATFNFNFESNVYYGLDENTGYIYTLQQNQTFNKTTNIMNTYGLNLTQNNSHIIKNNYSTLIKNNLNHIINQNLTETIHKNKITTINQNLNINYNNTFNETLNHKTTNYLSSHTTYYNKGITNHFKDTLSKTTNGNITLDIKYNNNFIVNNINTTIKHHQLNILTDSVNNLYNNVKLISKTDYGIYTNLNKNKHINQDLTLTHGALNNIFHDTTNITIHKNLTNTTNNLYTTAHKTNYKYINKQNNKTHEDNLNINQKNLDILFKNSKNKFIHGSTNQSTFLNDYNIDYYINRNINISNDYNKFLKDKSTLFYNQSYTQILNNNNTIAITGNHTNYINKTNTLSIHNSSFNTYKNNLNTIIDFNNNFTIKGTNDSTYYKIFTKSFKNNINQTITNNLTNLIQDTNTLNYKDTHNLIVTNNNKETYKSHLTKTISQKTESIYNDFSYNKNSDSTLVVTFNNNQTLNNNNNITLYNNKFSTINNNFDIFSHNKNITTSTHIRHIKNTFTQTIGTNTTNNINNTVKGNLNIIFDNNVQETIQSDSYHNTIGNIQINLNSDYNKQINNNKNEIFKGTKLNIIKGDLIETVAGKSTSTITNDLEIIQHNAEIQITTK